MIGNFNRYQNFPLQDDKRAKQYAGNIEKAKQRLAVGVGGKRSCPRRMEILWPGHNYMGPGNPLENGQPTTHADNIARDHDYAYAHTWTEDHIKQADDRAKNQFLEHPTEVSSLVGYTGIALKNLVEKFTGTLYPNVSSLNKSARARSVMAGIRRKDTWYGSA